MTMVTLEVSRVDAKEIHQQIVQLESMQQAMPDRDSVAANTVASTLKLLHRLEDELRHQARVDHHH
ncbi:hypothetical protein [Agitococcus lubricus]|uniref:Uncharacterized protein n=1 Tax=Agitococcus lubricus TaxID=1077255 RepID=A0A2T5J3B1_9GAMM|nr:hypothetical protein [Agitococcus lubricus]PTQ90983.1 hypothetical protein C8N29_10153 [Agitococcus lubricus]